MSSGDQSDDVRRDVMVTPHNDQKGPGVLLLHSGRGLTSYIESLCHRLAHRGYVCYALDLFDGAQPTTIADAEAAKANESSDTHVDRVEDGVSFLTSFRGVSRPDIGVLGIGYGGELALRVLDQDPRDIRSVVVYYGYHDIDWQQLSAHFLGHFADRDPDIPRGRLNSAVERATDASVRSEFKLYEGTDPSFFEDEETARYDSSAANESWQRTLEFLDTTL